MNQERELARRFGARYRDKIIIVGLSSILLNLLVFSGSIYTMLVYDSVLPSRSLPTLTGLFVLVVLLYAFQYGFELIRSEALLHLADGIRSDLIKPIQFATADHVLKGGGRHGDGLQFSRSIDQVHSFLSGAGPVALIDLPWVLLFLLVLFSLHWWLGLTALAGALILAAIAFETSRKSTLGTQKLLPLTGQRNSATQTEIRFVELATALGMRDRLTERSLDLNQRYAEANNLLSRTASRLGGAGRIFRLFIQSLILTVGALLVIDGKASGGIIIASSVLSGRALAPVDQAIANWRGLTTAREGWSRLTQALTTHPATRLPTIDLPRPCESLVVSDLWVAPPGTFEPVLKGIRLALEPGQAVAIIGPSASGKSTLAKALLGIWPAMRGEIRLDGAPHDQWPAERIGAAQGYVPQVVELIEGTLGENIARFDPHATSDKVIAAAKAAGLHKMILATPRGYDTPVSNGGVEFSAGQRQRIGLARALYGDPFLVVLDEPNSNLDAEGDAALTQAIYRLRERGGIVLMVTHRTATLSPVSHVAVLNAGRLVQFGERDAILKSVVDPRLGAKRIQKDRFAEVAS